MKILNLQNIKLIQDIERKLEGRSLLTHSNTNPYMINNSYLKDLDVQQKFLIPQNSNFK